MLTRSLSSSVVFASALWWVGSAAPAHADLSKKVIAAFKGKLLVTTAPVESGGDDKSTIAALKKKSVASIAGQKNGDDVQEWTFNYTAFLSKTGSSTLMLEFYDGATYAADQTLSGVDPKSTVIEGEISIDEDQGLTKGKKYTFKLVGKIKGKEVVVAQSATPISMD
jgi:hypothetical protein